MLVGAARPNASAFYLKKKSQMAEMAKIAKVCDADADAEHASPSASTGMHPVIYLEVALAGGDSDRIPLYGSGRDDADALVADFAERHQLGEVKQHRLGKVIRRYLAEVVPELEDRAFATTAAANLSTPSSVGSFDRSSLSSPPCSSHQGRLVATGGAWAPGSRRLDEERTDDDHMPFGTAAATSALAHDLAEATRTISLQLAELRSQMQSLQQDAGLDEIRRGIEALQEATGQQQRAEVRLAETPTAGVGDAARERARAALRERREVVRVAALQSSADADSSAEHRAALRPANGRSPPRPLRVGRATRPSAVWWSVPLVVVALMAGPLRHEAWRAEAWRAEAWRSAVAELVPMRWPGKLDDGPRGQDARWREALDWYEYYE